MTLVEITIAASLFLVCFTYLIFPVVIQIMASILRNNRKVSFSDTYRPTVAIICAMYNEEDVVEYKIKNFKELTCPEVRLYIGSDGSSDRTNQILQQHSGDHKLCINLFPRRGKVHVINDLTVLADEDIFVFTDANSMYAPDAIEKLVQHFSDSSIGAVCGRLHLVDKDNKSGEGFYWRYETMLKRAESVFKCVIGGNGAIYAVRRELVEPLPSDTINDDFTLSMRVLQQGYGMVYAEDAVATEEVAINDSIEFKRHIRDAAGHYRAMKHLYPLLNPLHFKRFFFYVSHRVIRWFVPHLMILLIVLPLFFLESKFVRLIAIGEIFFYLLAIWYKVFGFKSNLFYIPYYFTYINVALFIGFIKNLIGIQKVTWDSTQRN